MNDSELPTALIIFHPGMEEVEALTPVDLLRRAGITVTTASTGEGIHIEGRNSIVVHADTELDSVLRESFQCILIPGGPGTDKVRRDERVRDLIRKQNQDQRWIAAICAAPLVLKDAGVLENRKFTGHQSITEELPELDARAAVVVDANLITSRGAGTAIPFSLAIIEMLRNTQISKEVAGSIHWGQ